MIADHPPEHFSLVVSAIIFWLSLWLILDEMRHPSWRLPGPPPRTTFLLDDTAILLMATLGVVSAIGGVLPRDGRELDLVRMVAALLRGPILVLLIGIAWHRLAERRRRSDA